MTERVAFSSIPGARYRSSSSNPPRSNRGKHPPNRFVRNIRKPCHDPLEPSPKHLIEERLARRWGIIKGGIAQKSGTIDILAYTCPGFVMISSCGRSPDAFSRMVKNMLARSNRIQTGCSLRRRRFFRSFYFSDTQPGKSGTKKVDEIPLLWILGFFDRFVQDFPGK
uniref:Uncharacterized protein n=1 Tax=Candidatus Kentrum sp. LPFa TaxID=2126335 RepID=A0A450W260_9GAMM|nr:MAG: hypothetical protein BECKLPF1236A_GA0070988_100494 [Candidatus Kentron sp. LPFa]VFK27000.1 MAG: hypothetical protein BECKLPF1236C_GA0070990_100416 [Candidatus Kentron sp. LPFa]